MAQGESVAVASEPADMTRRRAGARSRAGTWPGAGTRAHAESRASETFWQSTILQLQQWIRAEAGPGRLLPWVPVAFGAGIAVYFSADREPMAAVVVPVALLFCGLAFVLRKWKSFSVMVLIAAMIAGFATATLKSAILAHHVLTRPIGSAALKGFVETHEVRARTDRFVLRVVQMNGPRGTPKIERVRLSVRKGTAPAVGSFIELKARLLPPLRPLRPGGYDFGREMYFSGIGASGFALGSIKVLETPPRGGGLALRYASVMQEMRDGIDARIRTVLGGDNRAIATALLTGRRDAITTPVNDAMFISGLGHVLSISGYHMAVVAGVVFFAVRALLALSPILAAGYAIKKWAAAAALAAALFYLLLSGAEVATQRSFFMAAVVLIAVMVDRRAITFRTLAVAAMLVLTLAPQALVHPSFQMSFAATLGLVAMVQIGMPRLLASPDNSQVARAALWGGREVMLLAATSLIAGLATMPYVAFHFHRVTPYGVLANLAAMPVVSALVMPAGLLGIVAIPFGFDGVFWKLMDLGIDWMVAVSQWVATLPGAIGRMVAFGPGPLLVTTTGILALGLLRSKLRWAGAVLIVLGTLWALGTRQPDIMVAGDGRTVGVRGKDGLLRVMRTSKDAFLLREWLAADADARPITDPGLSEGVSCDEAGCVVMAADGKLVALNWRPEALADDCARAAVMVSAHPPPDDCAALVLDRNLLEQRGTLALHRHADGFAIKSVHPPGGDRPWSPRGVAAASGVAKIQSGRIAPMDATPREDDMQAED